MSETYRNRALYIPHAELLLLDQHGAQIRSRICGRPAVERVCMKSVGHVSTRQSDGAFSQQSTSEGEHMEAESAYLVRNNPRLAAIETAAARMSTCIIRHSVAIVGLSCAPAPSRRTISHPRRP